MRVRKSLLRLEPLEKRAHGVNYLRGMANDRFMGVRGHSEEHIQGVSDTMTGLGTSLPPAIEIGEQAVVAAGAVVRDS